MKKLLLILLCVPLIGWGQYWNQLGQDLDGEAAGDECGQSVSLNSDGNILAIGAGDNDGNGNDAGHVRIYENNSGIWTQLGGDIDGEVAGDLSGNYVSLSSDGTIVAIGARGNDENGSYSGHVRIYNWNGSSWNQLGQDIDGEAAYDNSGRFLSLSSDGNTVAIGARNNDGNLPDTAAGHVRIYNYNGTSWNQVGQDIDGEASYDWSGKSLSLSSDGGIVAIGAWSNDGNGHWSGHVRVYLNSNNTFIEYLNIDKQLLKVMDMLGREVTEDSNTPLFYIYDDGTVEKRIVIE